MTQAAKLKSVIRARASKTGESYTTARRQVLAAKPRSTEAQAKLLTPAPVDPTPAPAAAAPAPKAEARVPRGELSNRTSIKSTGKDLEHWFKVLDRFGKENGHTKAAEHLYAEHKVPGWHAQMITITWERSRGLRRENQSCTGTFQVSVSRSLAAPAAWIVQFLNDEKARKVWLKKTPKALAKGLEEAFASGKSLEPMKSCYARMRYKWLSSTVELRLYAKGHEKSSLVADSSNLPDAEAVGVRRQEFSEALDALRDLASTRVAA